MITDFLSCKNVEQTFEKRNSFLYEMYTLNVSMSNEE